MSWKRVLGYRLAILAVPVRAVNWPRTGRLPGRRGLSAMALGGLETSSIPAAKLEMATKLLLMAGILWPSLSENRELLGLRLGRNELFSLERQ